LPSRIARWGGDARTKADKIAGVKLPLWARALDAVAIVSAIVTVSVAITGALISVTDWSRPLLWCAVALIARHAVVRRDPLPQRIGRGLAAWWRHPDTLTVLPIHLATRLGVIVVGFISVLLIGFPPESSARWRIYSNDLLDLPARWDAGWYLTIANVGYSYTPDSTAAYQQNIAFFPAYPMTVRFFAPLFGRHTLWVGVLVSLVAFYIALAYLLRLARSELGNEDQAMTTVMLIATYPFAVFFSAVYTESLFLLTLVGAVYHFRRDELWRSALWGFACGLTRPPGCFLSVVLGLMAVRSAFAQGAFADRALVRRLLAASAPGLGMLTFSAFIYRLTGHPFQWTMQNAAWGRVYKGLDEIVTLRYELIANNGLYDYVSTQTIDLFYSLAVILCLAAVWPVYRRFGLPYAVFIVLNVLPPMSAGGMLSMGRVTSVLFPVFLWMGAAVPAHHRTAWITFFAILQAFVAVMFFTWRPIF
jgi:hypothetical protein